MVMSMFGVEASRDENITSGSFISSILRAIPGGDQSGFVQKNSSRVLFRAAFHLWIFHNSPLTVKSWIALRMTLQLLLGHQRKVVNHICLQQHILFACIADNNER